MRACILLCLLTLAPTASAQPAPVARPPLDDLAGRYIVGDHPGFNWVLDLEPYGAFQFRSHGCFGTYADLSGNAELRSGTLYLQIDFVRSNPFEEVLPLQLTVVRWGQRVYLIQPGGELDFANAINLQIEPRIAKKGIYMLREGDWEVPVPFLPRLPPHALSRVLTSSVRGQVLSVDDAGRAEISVGERHGLRTGQYLWAKDEAGEQIAVEVVQTAESSGFVERREVRYDSFGLELVPGLRITGGP